MLRTRVIAVLTFNDGVLFRTKLFRPDYRYTANFVDTWSVDELVMLDVTRDGDGSKKVFLDAIKQFASRCFVPISVGGGIRNLSDVRTYLNAGADKVVINSHSKTDPWWIIYPGKNAHKHLEIKAHPNQRQYSLMFNQPGEYRITGTQKTASGEMANFTRSLTFVVN